MKLSGLNLTSLFSLFFILRVPGCFFQLFYPVVLKCKNQLSHFHSFFSKQLVFFPCSFPFLSVKVTHSEVSIPGTFLSLPPPCCGRWVSIRSPVVSRIRGLPAADCWFEALWDRKYVGKCCKLKPTMAKMDFIFFGEKTSSAFVRYTGLECLDQVGHQIWIDLNNFMVDLTRNRWWSLLFGPSPEQKNYHIFNHFGIFAGRNKTHKSTLSHPGCWRVIWISVADGAASQRLRRLKIF